MSDNVQDSSRYSAGSGDSQAGVANEAALAQAVQALTGVTQSLADTAAQIAEALRGQTVAGAGGQLAAGPAQINIFDDDPFSEPVPTPLPPIAPTVAVSAPTLPAAPLQFAIAESAPPPAPYTPGTADFRFWLATEALVRGIQFWRALLPAGTRWSTQNTTLQVRLIAGQRLNASYSRVAGLRFFQQTVQGVPVASAESPDVVLHELGHALLDALRPQLFNAASLEVDAFHESFGDMVSILCALQLPGMRQRVLSETQGRLNVNSRLSRLAEQLGWGIRQLSPTAVDGDSLRNAANRFFYQRPETLPPQAPARQLSSESHSFSRVFTGAFLDALARMFRVAGAPGDAALQTAVHDLGQLLVDGVRTAPIVPAYYSEVAAAMIQADTKRNGGRYRAALNSAFVERGILSPTAAASLPTGPTARGRAAAAASVLSEAPAREPVAVDSDAPEMQDHLRGFDDAPELPVHTLPFSLAPDVTILVHAPDEPERFGVSPAALDVGEDEGVDANYAAACFVEDLLRLSRVEVGAELGLLADAGGPSIEATHTLEETPEGMVLKRLHFNCGFCRRG